MIEYIVSLTIILLVWAYFKLYLEPKKRVQWYQKTLEALGYKVLAYPFKFMGSYAFELLSIGAKQHNDAQWHMKNVLPQYDVVIYNTLYLPTLQFLNPELVKHVFHPDNIYVHFKFPFLIRNVQRSLGKGIAFSEGKEWKRKRAIMNAVFNFDFMMESIPKISRICEESITLVEAQCKQNGKYKELEDSTKVVHMNIFELFAGTFSNVMLECFFGSASTHEKINDQSIPTFINKLNADITKQGFELPLVIFGVKFAELGLREKDRDINNRIVLLRELADRMIRDRLKQLEVKGPRENYQDIIEALVFKKSFDTDTTKKVKVSKEDADNYDFRELIDEFCTFFTAGTDTTSHYTQMMIYLIAGHPEVEARLRKQIDEVIKADEDINRENLKKLTYIDWIQTETTRYYGPGNGLFIRVAQKDHNIANIPVLKGTGVTVQPGAAHFSEKYYKDPHVFRPERWQSQCAGNPPFTLGGFSGGPRSCIGKHLAMLESKIALVKFVRRYKSFRLPKKDYKLESRFLIEPEPMQVQLRIRE